MTRKIYILKILNRVPGLWVFIYNQIGNSLKLDQNGLAGSPDFTQASLGRGVFLVNFLGFIW